MRIAGFDGVFIHPDAEIGEFVRIDGSYVGANAEIRHSAYLRKGVGYAREQWLVTHQK